MERPPILAELYEASGKATWQRHLEDPIRIRDSEHWDRPGGLFLEAVTGEGLTVIAEHKRRSPSKGPIREDWGVVETIAAYDWGGAGAISVLTESSRFGGSIQHLEKAREVTALPILRKDFIEHPRQLVEAKNAGADAALLIVGGLPQDRLHMLRYFAEQIRLDTLLEVHDEQELERALALEPQMIGINNRDLGKEGYPTDWETTRRLTPLVPERIPVITESGYRIDQESIDELAVFAAHGGSAVLVGEAFMREDDPEAAVRQLARL